MKNTIYTVLLISLMACGQGGEPGEDLLFADSYEGKMELMDASARTSQVSNPVPQERSRKVIKNGNIHFRTEDMLRDREAIADMLPGFDAYMENDGEDRTESRISTQMTIRVPSDRFDSLYNTISGMADHLESRSANIQDATERYYDLESRISSKKALEERYLELLKDAGRMTDVLEIERSLNQVRTEIEQLQAQFNYLSKQISLSTLYVSFYEELPFNYEPGNQRGFLGKILQALDNGWQGFLSVLVGLFTLWPFILLFMAATVLYRRFRGKKRRKAE